MFSFTWSHHTTATNTQLTPPDPFDTFLGFIQGGHMSRHFLSRMTIAACIVAASATMQPALVGIPQASAQVQAQQVALTPKIVESVIDSYPKVLALSEELSAKYGVEDSGSDDPGASLGGFMAYQDAMNQLNGLVGQYGFSDLMTYAMTMSSVAQAFAFSVNGGMDEQMSQALAQVQNNPNLSDEQKKMIMEQMGAASAAMDSMRPTQQNLDAVAPYTDQLQTMFDAD